MIIHLISSSLDYLGIPKVTFEEAFGAAFGGFLGVILFFGARLVVELCVTRPKTIRTYMCVTPLNRGKKPEMRGELEHHRGKVVEDRETLKKFGVDHEVWEWSRDPTETGEGDCLFFGPYSMDATEPGLYEAVFRIRGSGFQKPKEIASDWDIISLDVYRTRIETGLSGDGKTVARYPLQEYLARQNVRVSDLTRSGWRNYTLRFYSGGQGELEYRSSAFDGVYPNIKRDLIKNCGTSVRIFFDTVTIKRLKKFSLPWG